MRYRTDSTGFFMEYVASPVVAIVPVTPEQPSECIVQQNNAGDPAAVNDDAERLFVERAAYKLAWERCNAQLKSAHADLLELRNAESKLKRRLAERTLSEDALRRLAYHDTLTGLANRLLLRESLAHEIVQAKRRQTRLATLFLDLDRFKDINDAFGHAAGDAVLKQVSSRLTACVRAGDIVCRYGGDEFVLVLIDIGTATQAVRIARKVIAQVSAPYPLNSHEVRATASIGIAIYPENGQDVDSLVENADTAMLGVKVNGRNHYEFVTDRKLSRAVKSGAR